MLQGKSGHLIDDHHDVDVVSAENDISIMVNITKFNSELTNLMTDSFTIGDMRNMMLQYRRNGAYTVTVVAASATADVAGHLVVLPIIAME